MRRLLCLASFSAVVLLGVGCSSSRESRSSGVATYTQAQAGNIAASDALGFNLTVNQRVQTAFVPSPE